MSLPRFRTATLASLAAAGAGLALGASLLAFADDHGRAQRPTGAPVAQRCLALVAPSQVPVESEAFVIEVHVPEWIGPVAGAALDPASSVRVVAVERLETSLVVELDTSAARPGEWAMVVRGSRARCEGLVSVTETR